MKKTTSILLIIVLFTGSSFAQDQEKAKEILDHLSKVTQNHPSIDIEFNVHFHSMQSGYENSSEGSLKMKGEKYLLDFMETRSYFDGTTLWSYLKDVEEVNISEPTEDSEDIMANPKNLFTVYDKDYKMQYRGHMVDGDKYYEMVDLFPNDLDQEYSRIRLTIDTEDYSPAEIQLFQKDGSVYTVTINKYETNQTFPDSLFVFPKEEYPEAEIIDLRW